jgi:hypothetical protein
MGRTYLGEFQRTDLDSFDIVLFCPVTGKSVSFMSPSLFLPTRREEARAWWTGWLRADRSQLPAVLGRREAKAKVANSRPLPKEFLYTKTSWIDHPDKTRTAYLHCRLNYNL